ncbi:MAG: hypothetical protein Q4D98_06640 [Planctomycetia bacterium]|nr:hypothetical protein [Planctomycetia bacterium]
MKRTLFILLLGLVPLLVLTVGSFVDFISVPPRSVPDDSELLESLRIQSASTRSFLRSTATFEENLSATELLFPVDEGLFEETRPMEFRDLVSKFEAWNSVSQSLMRYLELLREFGSKDLLQLKRTMSQFESFRKQFATLPGVDPKMAKLMEIQGKELEARVTKAEKNAQAAELLVEARNSFELERYAICRDKCNKLLADYKDVLENTVRLSVVRLKARAEVHAGKDLLGELKLKDIPAEEKLAKIEKFLHSYADVAPEDLEDEERAQYEELRKTAQSLRMETEHASNRDEIQQMVNGVQRETSLQKTLSAALAAVAKIQEHEAGLRNSGGDEATKAEMQKDLDAQKKRIRTMVRKALFAKVPKKETKLDDLIQEAELKDGTVLLGYFREVKMDGKVVGYKCYSSRAELEHPTGSVGTNRLDRFAQKPAMPMEVRLCQRYVALRKKVYESPGSRGLWVDFQNQCQKMQDEWDAHLKKTGKKSTLSFQDAVSVARMILDDANWDRIKKVF